MICWLSLGRWFNSGSKEIGFKFGMMHLTKNAARFPLKIKRLGFLNFLVSCCGLKFSHLSISQLVEQSTVDEVLAMLRSLV